VVSVVPEMFILDLGRVFVDVLWSPPKSTTSTLFARLLLIKSQENGTMVYLTEKPIHWSMFLVRFTEKLDGEFADSARTRLPYAALSLELTVRLNFWHVIVYHWVRKEISRTPPYWKKARTCSRM